MSSMLALFAESYVAGRLDSRVFAEAYIELWKIERDMGLLQLDDPNVSESLSTIFVLADLFNADPGRKGYELDDEGLRSEVSKILRS